MFIWRVPRNIHWRGGGLPGNFSWDNFIIIIVVIVIIISSSSIMTNTLDLQI
jgi:hypothetical protein